MLTSVAVQILTLEKRLHDQVSVRCALERALGYRASSHDITNEATIPKVSGLYLSPHCSVLYLLPSFARSPL